MPYKEKTEEKKRVEYTWSELQMKQAWEEYLKFKDKDQRIRRMKWLALRNAIVIYNPLKLDFGVIPENYEPMDDLFKKMEQRFGKRIMYKGEIDSLEKIAASKKITTIDL